MQALDNVPSGSKFFCHTNLNLFHNLRFLDKSTNLNFSYLIIFYFKYV